MKLGFGSDNHSGVHPRFFEAMLTVNAGHQPSYGVDDISKRVRHEFERVFGDVEFFFTFNGTAANVLALNALVSSYNSVLATDIAHIHCDECGAPEKLIGCKVQVVSHKQGKLTAQDIQSAWVRRGDQHYSQLKAVSLTQPTEYGTVYSLQELKEITDLCKKLDLLIHMDGARFFVACESLNVSPRQLTQDLGIDVLTLSGTKNGFLLGEAVVFFNPRLSKDFKFFRKQFMQLPSKTRFFAAQFEAYLRQDFFKDLAQHEISMAQYLASKLSNIDEVKITQPVQANSVFVTLPKSWVKPLKKNSFFYIWDETKTEARLMTSFDTSIEQIESFTQELKRLKSVAPSS